jgi:hypothetical protein
VNPPQLPFPDYKWRWATVTCTEGLNAPPVFLGVLRALQEHEGQPPSDKSFIKTLQEVEAQTKTRVHLARSTERNIIRNSGQYWKALGLLGDIRGNIKLTQFGRDVALGKITKTEFATVVIKTLQLPNLSIQQDVDQWTGAGLVIKPLELICQ